MTFSFPPHSKGRARVRQASPKEVSCPALGVILTDAPFQRDRERTTVLVSKLPQVAADEDLHKLFKDVSCALFLDYFLI